MSVKILIVEDEGLIALSLKQHLEDIGYTVPAIADNADDALLCVDREKPALVLMDIRIRGNRNGIEAAAVIRRTFQVPVIFVTAHADRETLGQAKIAEPFGYIVKPFAGVDFRAQIEMALWKHKMEHKLRVSEAWLSATFRSVADALIATDPAGNVAFMNAPAARLTGWHWKDAKGRPLLDVFRVFEAESGVPVVHPLEAIYDGRELRTETNTFRMKSPEADNDVYVEAEMSANRCEDGELLGIVVVFRDVTDRLNAEKRERQLHKMNAVTLLATGLARELSGWQRRMDECLSRLVSETGSRRLHRILEEAYVCSGHQTSIVNQLAALAKTEPGHPSEVDLNETLASLEGRFKGVLGSSRRLRLELQAGLPPIMIDAEELKENLLRLILTSREAMPDGGVTHISTRTVLTSDRNVRVQMSVRDSGKAFLPGVQQRVFEPYFQSRRGTPHSGVSLALVYHFVALSGGTIEAETGEGATAYLLTFPIAQQAVPISANAQAGVCVA